MKFNLDGIVDGFVQPTTIKAFLRAKEIKLTWQPPLHTKRGKMMYRIEWREKLKPAAETKKADTKVHIYTIKKLKPNTEYDIRVLAFVPGTLPAEPGEEKVSKGIFLNDKGNSSDSYNNCTYNNCTYKHMKRISV